MNGLKELKIIYRGLFYNDWPSGKEELLEEEKYNNYLAAECDISKLMSVKNKNDNEYYYFNDIETKDVFDQDYGRIFDQIIIVSSK